MANFALKEHAARGEAAEGDSNALFLSVSPEEVESGSIDIVVLEAQRQVRVVLLLFLDTHSLFYLADTFLHTYLEN